MDPVVRGMCRVGGIPLEVAPLVCVEMSGDRRLVAWRSDRVPANDAQARDMRAAVGKDEACGKVLTVRIAKSRFERGLMRADVAVGVEGRKAPLKLWLPRPGALKARWLEAFGRASDATKASSSAAAAVEELAAGEFTEDSSCGEMANEETPEDDDEEDVVDLAGSEARLGEVWRRLEADEESLPQGWRQLRDKVTGNDYYLNEVDNRTTWSRPAANNNERTALSGDELGVAWLLDAVASDEVDALLDGRASDAPILGALIEEAKACPLVARDGWAESLRELFETLLPKLVLAACDVQSGRARALVDDDDDGRRREEEERGGRFHLTQAQTQPLFFLSRKLAKTTPSSPEAGSLEQRFSRALRSLVDFARREAAAGDETGGLLGALSCEGTGVASLPETLRDVVVAGLPLLVLRICRATRPRSERYRRIKAALDACPRNAVVAALRVGAFPSSPSFIKGLVDVVVKTKVRNGETVAQRLARANLGLEDLEAELATLSPPLRARVGEATDEELETIEDDIARAAGVQLDDETKMDIQRAARLEAYRRAAERLVAAYGEPAYVDLVSSLYPAIFEPVAAIFVDRSVKAADLVEKMFKCAARAVKSAGKSDLYSTYDRLVMLDADLAALADDLVDFLKRAAKADATKWAALGAWLRKLVDSLSLALSLPDAPDPEGLDRDLGTLVAEWNGRDQDIGALAFVSREDLPCLAQLVPTFAADIRAQFQARRAEAVSVSSFQNELGAGRGDA